MTTRGLQVGTADLGDRLTGLTLSTVEVWLPKAGGAATTSGAGRYTDAFTFAGTFELPERLDRRLSTLIDVKPQMPTRGAQSSASADARLAQKGKLTVDAGSFDAGRDTGAAPVGLGVVVCVGGRWVVRRPRLVYCSRASSQQLCRSTDEQSIGTER